MKGYSVFVIILFSLSLATISNAQYWFQFGVRGGPQTYFNTGISATIETVSQSKLTDGSAAYWIGETLSNGAFLQEGYLIQNESASYPTLCTSSGCSDYEYIPAGDPEWFYEYFPPNYNSSFLGGVGPVNSAGINGTYNNYSFYSEGDTWVFTFNGKQVGSVMLGTSSTDSNDSVAFGELANATSNNTYLYPVSFLNISIQKDGVFTPLGTGYSYIGYGIGSEDTLKNSYGVAEVPGRTNYFAVGSGLPQPQNFKQLWQVGYQLKVRSQYGNINSSTGYAASYPVALSAPSVVYVDNTTREIFAGWSGEGFGSYTGIQRNISIALESNVTETAVWRRQYYINVTSIQSTASGSGWYFANATVSYSVPYNLSYENSTARYALSGWSTGDTAVNGSIDAYGPMAISAAWTKEYYVNATSEYGAAEGSGWYASGSTADISLQNQVSNASGGERLAFYSWSNGNTTPGISFKVDAPISLNALYRDQYLVDFVGRSGEGNLIKVGNVSISNSTYPNSTFLYSGVRYRVDRASYEGVDMPLSYEFEINSSGNVYLPLPVYNTEIRAQDIFGRPVNASYIVTFANGSVATGSSGPSGTIEFMNVPYGMVNGTASYLGMRSAIDASDGRPAVVTFISFTDIVGFGFMMVLGFIAYLYSRRRLARIAQQYPPVLRH